MPENIISPRVCVVIESYYPVVGGMESQARTLSAGLSRLGVPHQIVTRRVDTTMAPTEQVDGVPVTRIGPVGPTGRWRMALKIFPWLLRHRKEYDVVFVPGFRVLGVSAVLAGKWTGKPCVLKADSRGELSGSFFTAGFQKRGISGNGVFARMFLALWRRVLRPADAFVSMSDEMSREFLDHGVPADRIHTIPNAVDTHRFCPVSPAEKSRLRTELCIPQDRLVFIYTGRLVSYKGLPGLLEAWRQNANKDSGDLLLLVGGGGHDLHNCEDDLRRFVADHGLEGSVRFCGETKEVHRYLQSADIFVFPTEEEAFGLSLIEAMACGLASISTPVGGIRDFLREGENGYVIPPGSVTALAEAMSALKDDPDLCVRLGEGAVSTVQQLYASGTVSARYAELFRDIYKN